MISFEQFLNSVLQALNSAKVPYMLGGAIAVWPWGEPRTTQDVDVVIHLIPAAINPLSEALEKAGLLIPPDVILDNLLETRGDIPLNAIHGESGFKAEMFLLREGDELRESAFQRRRKVDMGGEIGEVYVHSPEDLILYKLLYYSISRQTKHIRDIGSMLIIMENEIDYTYIQTWVEKKGLNAIWEEIRNHI